VPERARQLARRLPTEPRFDLAWEGRAVLAEATAQVAPEASAGWRGEARAFAVAWLDGFPPERAERLLRAPGGIGSLADVLKAR